MSRFKHSSHRLALSRSQWPPALLHQLPQLRSKHAKGKLVKVAQTLLSERHHLCNARLALHHGEELSSRPNSRAPSLLHRAGRPCSLVTRAPAPPPASAWPWAWTPPLPVSSSLPLSRAWPPSSIISMRWGWIWASRRWPCWSVWHAHKPSRGATKKVARLRFGQR